VSASKEELSAAMRRIADSLDFIETSTGEVIYLDGKTRLEIARHQARAGADVDPSRAIIKRRPIPARPGGIAGAIEWVSVDAPDSPIPDLTSAVGPIPDPEQLVDALPWHVRTRIEGNFQ
jgi:hypothetical protein